MRGKVHRFCYEERRGIRCLLLGLILGTMSPALAASSQEAPVAGPTHAQAPPPEVERPPSLTQPDLSLSEAVRLTLRHDPQINLEKQAVALAAGRLQQATGIFDQILAVIPAYSYVQQENFPFIRRREIDRRNILLKLSEAYGALSQSLREALETDSLDPPICPEGLEFEDVDILEGRDQTRRSGVSFSDAFIIRVSGLESEMDTFSTICVPAGDVGARPSTTYKILDRINEITGLGLNEILVDLTQIQKERLALGQQVAEAITTKARLSYDRLAEVPDDEVTKSISIDLGYSKRFRTGIDFSADFRLQSSERNFKDKPLDPAFGAMGVRNGYPSSASVSFDVPLLKGRGRVSAAAPERAAQSSVEAQRERLRHTISAEVFRTVLAYLDVAAAQESVNLLEESAARQQRLVELTEQLIEADEVPRTELNRARARAAVVMSGLAQGKLSLLTARFVLAQAIGLNVAQLSEAPLASDAFAPFVAMDVDVESLTEEAISQRRDLKSASQLREAARILADAAQADLKRELNFFVTAGMSTLYESPFFRYLPDELDEVPEDTPIQYYSPRGYWRSLTESWKPFFTVGLTLDFPFRNNVAEGRLLQEQSSLTSSEIELTDLERIIRDNLVDVGGALEHASRVVERRRDAIAYYEETLKSSLQRYQLGEITLLDTITTEEDLTREQVQMVRAMQVYLSLLARLRFEAGNLISFAQEGTPLESIEFDSTAFIAGE